MRIRLKLYATLKQYIPNSAELVRPEGWEVEEGVTVDQVMKTIGLPENMRVLALVNGAHCHDVTMTLKEGDTVLFYPLMSGG